MGRPPPVIFSDSFWLSGFVIADYFPRLDKSSFQ